MACVLHTSCFVQADPTGERLLEVRFQTQVCAGAGKSGRGEYVRPCCCRAGKLARIRRQEAEAAAKLAGKLPAGESQRQAAAVATAGAAEAVIAGQLALGPAGQKQKSSKRKAPATAAVTPDAEADAAARKAAKRARRAEKAGAQSAGAGSEAGAATAAEAPPSKKARIVVEPVYQSLPGTHAAFTATPTAGEGLQAVSAICSTTNVPIIVHFIAVSGLSLDCCCCECANVRRGELSL